MRYLKYWLLLCLLLPTAAPAQESMELGKFSVMPNITINMLVTYNGNDIGDSEQGYTRVDYDPAINDFPAPGWQTLKVNMFTGGANCCMGYYLLSQSKDKAVAAYLPPTDQYMTMDGAYLTVNDPYFMYYQADAVNTAGLNRAESPRLSRVLVFADNQWRADKPGEFPDFYNKQIAEIKAEKNMPLFSRDIALAYYTLMSGKSVDEAKRQFMINPAQEYKSVYAAVFKDIEKAVREFTPVLNLDLPAN